PHGNTSLCLWAALVCFKTLVLICFEKFGVEFVVLGREIRLDYDFFAKIKECREDEIINAFDPNRAYQHYLTPNLC
ncbi:hypothetical protein ACEE06_12195, partial [Staphylococcus epidermidis]